eukprot:symbB.v1.2.030992.t1/scaffold3549.1/size54238/2
MQLEVPVVGRCDRGGFVRAGIGQFAARRCSDSGDDGHCGERSVDVQLYSQRFLRISAIEKNAALSSRFTSKQHGPFCFGTPSWI